MELIFGYLFYFSYLHHLEPSGRDDRNLLHLNKEKEYLMEGIHIIHLLQVLLLRFPSNLLHPKMEESF